MALSIWPTIVIVGLALCLTRPSPWQLVIGTVCAASPPLRLTPAWHQPSQPRGEEQVQISPIQGSLMPVSERKLSK